MLINEREQRQDCIINNLLNAHERMAREVTVNDLPKYMVFSKYLLRQIKKGRDRSINLFPEKDSGRHG